MAATDVLIVLRADVAIAFRNAVVTQWSVASNYISGVQYRRTGDTPGTFSHYVGHGRIPEGTFSTLRTILQDVTDGIRDSVDWQNEGSGGTLADADWAVAYAAGDPVAAYMMTGVGGGSTKTPQQGLDFLGLVPTSADADDGIA